MNTLGLPGALESVAILTVNAADQMRQLGQAMRRADLAGEVPGQHKTTLAALKLARESIAELETMLKPDTKRKAKP
jgi:hypothetical protein